VIRADRRVQQIASPRRQKSVILLAVAVLGIVSLLNPASLPGRELPAQEAGRHIYTTGESPSRKPLEAVLGDGSTVVPATLMPCASCHGTDGKGRPEGGIEPSDIRWSTLTRPSAVDSDLGRRRPAYNTELLHKVLSEGVDPGGNKLGPVMPRYHMAKEDLESLIAHLKLLGNQDDPGLSDTTIRVATIVPANGPLAAAGDSSSALLHAYFDSLNQQGGIYGRTIELEVMRAAGTPAETALAARDFIKTKNIFAVVGVLAPGAERDLSHALETSGAPVIDALPANPEEDSENSSTVFHIFSGLAQQARALLRYSQKQSNDPEGKTAVVFPQSHWQVAKAVLDDCSPATCMPIAYGQFDSNSIASALNRKSSKIIFLGTGSELRELLYTAHVQGWTPNVYQPGSLSGENIFLIPQEFIDHVFFSFPALPADIKPEAFEEYVRLVSQYRLKPVQPARSLCALASAKVFVEALRQAGRQLGREQLVAALSSMYNFSTGLTPPVTYTTTRRTGALGAHVVQLDLKNKSFILLDPWIVP
jgi:ABC-type branched-subunit amino acid transport system substrate-binding protein